MDTEKNYFDQLPEKCRRLLREKSGISNNEELIAWLPKVPEEKLIEEYSFPEDTLSEIKKSKPYSQAWNLEIPFEMGFEVKKKKKNPPRTFTFGASEEETATLEDDDIIDEIARDLKQNGPNEMPDKADLSGRFGPVRDQGSWGSCVAFATVAAIEHTLDFIYDFSERFCYYTTKLIDGIDYSQGTRFEYAIEALERYGICTRETLPYSVEHIMEEPPRDVYDEARGFKYRKHDEHQDGCIIEFIKRMISGLEYGKELVVSAGVDVFESAWINEITVRTGKVLYPFPGELSKGGHAITIVGFVIDSSFMGGGYFIFRNSWGEKFGADALYAPAGYGIISFEYVKRFCDEAIVIVEMEVEEVPVHHPSSNEETIVMEYNNTPFTRAKHSKLGHQAFLGESGSGKSTYTMKSIVSNPAYKYFILDYHQDYAGNTSFIEKTDAVVWNVEDAGLPFNPLKVENDSNSAFRDSNNPENSENELGKKERQHVRALLGRFKACLPNLGARQSSMLEQIIGVLVYAVNILKREDVQISDMMKTLERYVNTGGERGRIAESLIDNLKPIFNLKILDHQMDITFEEFLRSNKNIIFLCMIPDDEDMTARKLATSFMVKGLFSYYQKTAAGDTDPIVIVQDEYHLAPKDLIYENIVREGRKFGVNLWVCSQEIKDVEPLLSNLASCKIFKVANGQQARQIARFLGWGKKSQDEIVDTIASLNLYEFYDPLAEKSSGEDRSGQELLRKKIQAA